MRRLIQDLDFTQADIESLRGKWRQATLTRDEQAAINVILKDWVAQLNLENDKLEKSLETLKDKQPLPNGTNTDTGKKKTAAQKLIDGLGTSEGSHQKRGHPQVTARETPVLGKRSTKSEKGS